MFINIHIAQQGAARNRMLAKSSHPDYAVASKNQKKTQFASDFAINVPFDVVDDLHGGSHSEKWFPHRTRFLRGIDTDGTFAVESGFEITLPTVKWPAVACGFTGILSLATNFSPHSKMSATAQQPSPRDPFTQQTFPRNYAFSQPAPSQGRPLQNRNRRTIECGNESIIASYCVLFIY